jgi:hypothetical protein
MGQNVLPEAFQARQIAIILVCSVEKGTHLFALGYEIPYIGSEECYAFA